MLVREQPAVVCYKSIDFCIAEIECLKVLVDGAPEHICVLLYYVGLVVACFSSTLKLNDVQMN